MIHEHPRDHECVTSSQCLSPQLHSEALDLPVGSSGGRIPAPPYPRPQPRNSDSAVFQGNLGICAAREEPSEGWLQGRDLPSSSHRSGGALGPGPGLSRRADRGLRLRKAEETEGAASPLRSARPLVPLGCEAARADEAAGSPTRTPSPRLCFSSLDTQVKGGCPPQRLAHGECSHTDSCSGAFQQRLSWLCPVPWLLPTLQASLSQSLSPVMILEP